MRHPEVKQRKLNERSDSSSMPVPPVKPLLHPNKDEWSDLISM